MASPPSHCSVKKVETLKNELALLCFAAIENGFLSCLEVMFSSGSGNRMGGASASPSISWQIAKVL